MRTRRRLWDSFRTGYLSFQRRRTTQVHRIIKGYAYVNLNLEEKEIVSLYDII